MNNNLKYYVCVGDSRGYCGVHHRTYAAAERHLEQDRQGCKGQGGYSDRLVEGRDENDAKVFIDEDGYEISE